MIAPVTGLAGGRFFARYFYSHLGLIESLKLWKGEGLIFYGGFLVAAAAVIAYIVFFRLPLLKWVDCLAPSAAVGLAFGRIGCFLGGCCWGDICADPSVLSDVGSLEARERLQSIPYVSYAGFPLAVRFPKGSDPYKQHQKWGLLTGDEEHSLPVHPVQLYEAAAAFGLTGLLWWAWKRPHREGDITLALLLGYAFIRFCTEFLRADNALNGWGLTFSQVVSLWIAAFCGLALVARTVLSRAPQSPLPRPREIRL
jgi:phosphatidylglycerol:prolipoprotein diacylglycerol transferase